MKWWHPRVGEIQVLYRYSGVFLKGFKEAIGVAVVLVVIYLALNFVVVCVGLFHVAQTPVVISNWHHH